MQQRKYPDCSIEVILKDYIYTRNWQTLTHEKFDDEGTLGFTDGSFSPICQINLILRLIIPLFGVSYDNDNSQIDVGGRHYDSYIISPHIISGWSKGVREKAPSPLTILSSTPACHFFKIWRKYQSSMYTIKNTFLDIAWNKLNIHSMKLNTKFTGKRQ